MSKQIIYLGSTMLGHFRAIILLSLVLLGLAGCGGSGSDSDSGSIMQIRPPSGDGPDLVISSLTISPEPSSLRYPGPITLSVRVTNQGNVRSQEIDLKYFFNGDVNYPTAMGRSLESIRVKSLDPSESFSHSHHNAISSRGGYFRACLKKLDDNDPLRIDVDNLCNNKVWVAGVGSDDDIQIRNVNVRIPASCPSEVQVCVRDHQCEDGDIARVSVNSRIVFSGELFNEWACYTVPVQAGRNEIEFFAVNGTGFKGQCSYADNNTGEIRVTGGNDSTIQEWAHTGGTGSRANLNVVIGSGAGTCTPR